MSAKKEKISLRHVGLMVRDLEMAVMFYQVLGFKRMGKQETLKVQKMRDWKGGVIELVQGKWHPHIAVTWIKDPDGNLMEVVKCK